MKNSNFKQKPKVNQNQKKKPTATSAKPVYKKKPKEIITIKDIQQKKKKDENICKITYVEPSDKYKDTINYLIKKGFFVAAKTGEKINLNSIIEFHVHTKNDVPVVVTEITKPSKYGGISKFKRVYKIVRFNEEEIVGIQYKITNPWIMKTIDISKFKEVQK